MQYTYAVFALPSATVTFPGAATVNGTQTVLTGQQITTQFNYSGPGTIGTIQWDIESQEGGSIVGGYTASQSLGKTQSVNIYNPSVTFYDGIQDTVTVNANAPVTFPDGTTGTLKASNQITVVKPTVAAPPFQISEYTNFGVKQHPNDTSSVMGANEVWSGVKITMPPGFSGGTGCFAQMIDSTSRTDTRTTGGTYTLKEQISSGAWVPIPAPCLDTNFSYPFAGQWQVSSTGSGGDQPYFQVAPPLNAGDAGRNDWYRAEGNDTFTTWIMYTPDTQNATDIWVPLGSFDWNWSDTANFNGNTNPPAWQGGAFVGSSGSITASSMWPTWTTYAYSGNNAMRQ